jgi:RNA polymerase sigma factor (sigma-70 family)
MLIEESAQRLLGSLDAANRSPQTVVVSSLYAALRGFERGSKKDRSRDCLGAFQVDPVDILVREETRWSLPMLPNDQSRVVLSISPEMRAIYDAHFALVWRYMAQRGVRQQHIDDLVHRVFRVVREHPGRREVNLDPAVLACMVARQVLREHQRGGFGREMRIGDGDAPTEIFERGAAQELLAGGLETLTELEREVYLLCEGEGMSTEDVADALGVQESTVQRRRASSNKQMSHFVGKLRKTGVWRGPAASYDHDLLQAAQAACTPSERDSDRVFAAMIAQSMASPLEFAQTELVAVPAARRPPRLPAPPLPAAPALPPPLPPPTAETAAALKEGTPRPLAQTWPPTSLRYQKSMLWSAAAAVALTFSLAGGYFLTPTNAAEAPAPMRVPAPPALQVGAAAPQPGAARALPKQPAAAPAPNASAKPGAAIKPEPVAAKPAQGKLEPAKPAQAKLEPAKPAQAEPDGKTRVPAAREAVAAAEPAPKAKVERSEPAKLKAAPSAREERAEAADAKSGPKAAADSKADAEEKISDARTRAVKRAQAAEAKLLFAAERNYRGGAPELALEMVANHRRQYPQSALSIERDVLHAQVLCALSRHREARRVIVELESNNASPAVLEAAERACGKAGAKTGAR